MAKKKAPIVDVNREAEILNSQVRMDGVGEDQVVKDLLSPKFVTAGDVEAGGIALALAELITGMKASSAQQEVIMKRFDKLEKAQQAWEENSEKFLQDVEKRAQSLIATSAMQKEKMMVDWMQAAQEAKIQAAAELATGNLMFEQKLATEPKETIISMGIMETHREGDNLVAYLVPEIIAIKNKKWLLKPGVPTEVPQTVANRYREIQRTRAVLKERQDLIKDAHTEAGEVAQKWNEINVRNKLGGDAMIAPQA